MEKELFINEGVNAGPTATPTWNSSCFGMDIHSQELNCSSEQLTNCFYNPNWDSSMDQNNNDPFESALSSMVSSPAASNAAAAAAAVLNGGGSNESVVLRELIGRLGSICNSADISPHHNANMTNSTNTSCYSTPLNSPPKLNLSMMDQQMRIAGNHPSLAPFAADPGFAERAARFSCFGSRSFNGRIGQFGQNESELSNRMESPKQQLPRVSSCHSLKFSGSQMGVQDNKKINGFSRSNTPENADSREESSVSEQIPGGEKAQNDANSRKRKSIPKGKAKAGVENDESNKKRSKSEEANENENGSGKSAGEKQAKDNSKPPEPPKDYIHVRARRGQATDSHSLAERVRREKISERMKFLQDLVPGCNKVTGKAVMLDEIINYVQSLQRQVEFLSMKLATVNPRMDINMEALLSKDILQSRATLPQSMYPLEPSSASAFPYGYQSQGTSLQNVLPNGTDNQFSMNPLTSVLRRTQGMQLPSIDGFGEAASQVSMWEDELHNVVQMGFSQAQPQSFQGSMTASQMKIEM